MTQKLKNFLNSLNLISSDNKLSITTILTYILTAKVVISGNELDLILFGLVLLNYAHKRYTIYKSERSPSNKELLNNLKAEFENYKQESEAKIQSLNDYFEKNKDRLIRIEQELRG
ncbi:hypothetical protein EHR02_00070 [Leptospira levettii]|uniref:hypothetical protein n=1 Tax=Leptospira levettii TaxID=2023178 RepID=UPI0010836755|nr:hypothetical protein [Leptospira levettii]TGM95033.1 hypothetical protein EHR02_00070 [Leptospira levettii]